ncbi:MAG: pyridoxamine 5'-phosphate oxidase family protein [Candidatus Promineifilaceae bacterium]
MTDSRTAALNYLVQHQVMTLAVRSGDSVWAAAVFYVNLEFSLFFLSARHTRHGQYLAANPWAAATIQEDYKDWQQIKGIQLEGPVQLLSGADQKMAIQVYGEKYPFIGKAKGMLATALKKVDWYRLTPSRLYYIDNSRGLGHREEVLLAL